MQRSAKVVPIQIERLRRHQTDEVELYDLAEQAARAVVVRRSVDAHPWALRAGERTRLGGRSRGA
ncbi:MAG: hypothetical protein JW751_03445 [Polyangiaceae bacterium]|nr:hypothetical protein [Polyangiaceae bacterium]